MCYHCYQNYKLCSSATSVIGSLHYFITILKELTKSHFRICMKDSAGYDNQRSDVTVDYLVIGGTCENIFYHGQPLILFYYLLIYYIRLIKLHELLILFFIYSFLSYSAFLKRIAFWL